MIPFLKKTWETCGASGYKKTTMYLYDYFRNRTQFFLKFPDTSSVLRRSNR
jgi:hypothetical protein